MPPTTQPAAFAAPLPTRHPNPPNHPGRTHSARDPRPPRLPKRQRARMTLSPERALPARYPELLAEAAAATRAALAAGETLLELQFPPVPNMATAALNELLDANRSHVRELLRAFTPRYAPDALDVVFPDEGEARLAARTFGEVPFRLRCIPDRVPGYVRTGGAGGEGLIFVVQPGFNVSEWINMELLEGDAPIVSLNADLDKVRGGYYPRLFYPGLHKVKTRFLSRFVPTYYLKQFSNGGTLMKRYPEDWKLFYRNAANDRTSLIWSGEERPQFVEVEKMLSRERVADLKS